MPTYRLSLKVKSQTKQKGTLGKILGGSRPHISQHLACRASSQDHLRILSSPGIRNYKNFQVGFPTSPDPLEILSTPTCV